MKKLGILGGFMLLAAFWATTAAAGNFSKPYALPEADRQAIHKVVVEQLSAFAQDNGPAAFAAATPSMQAKYKSPDLFMVVMRMGYKPVYRPRQVAFQGLIDIEGKPVQRLAVVDQEGKDHLALYVMESQANGDWRIGGCFLVPPDDMLI